MITAPARYGRTAFAALLTVGFAVLVGCGKKQSDPPPNDPPVNANVGPNPNPKPDPKQNPQPQPDPKLNPKLDIKLPQPDTKLPSPIKGTGPVGKVPLTDLDPETQVWDFTIRAPKGSTQSAKGERHPTDPIECYIAGWMVIAPDERALSVNITKLKLDADVSPLTFLSSGITKFKSDESDKYPFECIHLPQPVEINGLTGARSWWLYPQGALGFEVRVNYRFHVDGWAYVFMCQCPGKTEARARQRAELADAAICTFRKK